MNATERAALLHGFELQDEMAGMVDERTLEILDRRRRTAVVKRRGWLVRRMLLGADVIGLLAAMLLAEWVVSASSNAGSVDAVTETLLLVASIPGWIVVTKIYGLYEKDEERTDHSTADDLAGVFHVVTVCTWLFWAGTYLTGIAHPTAPKLVIFWIAAILFVCVGRAVARSLSRRSIAYLQNTVIVGAGEVGQLIAKKLLQHPEYGMNLVGFIDARPRVRQEDLGHLALLGDTARLPAIVRMLDVERVIIAFSNESHEETLRLLRELKDLEVQIDIVPRLFETVGPNVGIHTIEGIPLVGLPPAALSASSRFIKRGVDLGLSLLVLVVISPLLIAVAIAVRIDSSGPILYRHRRVGERGVALDVLKFRTMRLEYCRGDGYGGATAEVEFERLMDDPSRAQEFGAMYKLKDDPRVTRVGRVLRAASLDELPQLFNVLRGELSLVGPRPITADELGRYGPDADALLTIKPGVTGYWQINGRSKLSYEDRVRLDRAYVGGWSLKLDVVILVRTVRAIWTRAGAV